MRKIPEAAPRTHPLPLVVLDYRCHVPQGTIGFNYPPKVQKCLEKFSKLGPGNIMQEFDMWEMRDAQVLFQRATDMLEMGFEWTLQYGEPRNLSPVRYAWGTPCCRIQPSGECTDPNYKQDLQRPV